MLPTAMSLSRASTIGFVGLGRMGAPMAVNLFTKTMAAHKALLAEGRTSEEPRFVVCERDAKSLQGFLSAMGGPVEVAETGAEVAARAGTIFTMLPSTPQVEAVYLSPTGLLPGLVSATSETLLLDCTTLDPTAAKAVSARVSQETSGRAAMLDCPVSGGTTGASAATLTFMVGTPEGSKEIFDKALPYLARMAREGRVIHCGASGAGLGIKICNNLVLAVNQIALAEGLALGEALGLDQEVLSSVINTSSGSSWSSLVNSPLKSALKDYEPGFASSLMLKDVKLGLHAAHEHSLPTPMSWAASSIYESVCEKDAGKDFSVVYEWLRQKRAEGVERGWKE